MLGWREAIIGKIQYQQTKLILVHDYDYLLSDEYILRKLGSHGFDIIRFDDSMTFRYLYEQQYRLNSSSPQLVIYTNEDIVFPYEFQKQALEVEMDLQHIFPKFSAQVIRQINREDFDALYTVHKQYTGSSSDQETLEYIIKHLYKIPYDVMDSQVDLYKSLLSIHYNNIDLPLVVQNFLVHEWKHIPAYHKVPLEKIVESPTFFYHFMEQKWAEFVKEFIQVQQTQIKDTIEVYQSHPLLDGDVRRLMNDLFMEGFLSKVKVSSEFIPNWMRFGIEKDENEEDVEVKSHHLREKIDEYVQNATLYKDWQEISGLIGELKLTAILNDHHKVDIDNLMETVNKKFMKWMITQFHTLTSLPPYPKPKLVHHIPHVIDKERKNSEKVALLVLDGMNYSQWKMVQKYLRGYQFLFEEQQVFAWVPTLTSVSRQAILSGNIPLTFSQTIHTTASEEKLWKSFWENQGVLKQYVAYQKSLGKEKYDRKNIKALARKSTKVYGAVIDVIDQFTHHAVLGEKSITSDLKLWLETNYLVNLLDDLIDNGYTVYLTSDHGNTNATGIGRISEGVLVDQKGERVRVYNDTTLYEDAVSKLSGLKWSNVGLPDDYNVLLADYGQAFVPKNHSIVTHGGISIEEVIVPFVRVQKNKGSGLGE
ncbi:BREX-3 system phosphatase PglZ [Virgibacillus siamensis]|uniref:BREX-3 system phosphatase PglZ n=1 Tax=Virgibacillus siamensis TaxID=480071 RepID=A0ABN1GN94_9BACI